MIESFSLFQITSPEKRTSVFIRIPFVMWFRQYCNYFLLNVVFPFFNFKSLFSIVAISLTATYDTFQILDGNLRVELWLFFRWYFISLALLFHENVKKWGIKFLNLLKFKKWIKPIHRDLKYSDLVIVTFWIY